MTIFSMKKIILSVIAMVAVSAVHAVRINTPKAEMAKSVLPKYFDLQGRPVTEPRGLVIEQRPDGSTRKIYYRW